MPKLAPKRPGRPRKPPVAPEDDTQLFAVRLETRMVVSLDAFLAAEEAAKRGMRLNRSDVVRLLLEEGLAAHGFAVTR